MKRVSFLVLFLSIHCFGQNSTEIIQVKRNMSLGDKIGYKLIVNTKATTKVEEISKSVLKSINAEPIKLPIKKSELGFKKLYFNKETTQFLLFIEINLEGKNTSWIGYFINEKDTSSYSDTSSIYPLINSIYKKILYSEYEDSVFFQEKNVKISKSNYNDKLKTFEKLQKKINQFKDEIELSKNSIEKSKTEIPILNAQLPELEEILKSRKSEVNDKMETLNKLDNIKIEIDAIKTKLNKMTKNLNILEKDPIFNERLIQAQKLDIGNLINLFKAKETSWKENLNKSKSELKIAKKNEEVADDKLKTINKEINNHKDNIEDKTKLIEKLNIEVNEKSKQIDAFNINEKISLEAEIVKQESLLSQLKQTQALYR